MEVWKDIPGYKGYEISSFGRVRVKGGDFISQVFTGKPEYWYVNVYEDYTSKSRQSRKLRRVHNLVARAFLPNPDNLNHVDHIDRNPYNNNLDNLRWTTIFSNQRNTKNNVKAESGELVRDILNRCIKSTNHQTATLYTRWKRYTSKGWSLQEAIILTLEYYKSLPNI